MKATVKAGLGVFGLSVRVLGKGQEVDVEPFRVSPDCPPSDKYYQVIPGGGVVYRDLLEFNPEVSYAAP